MTRFAIAAAVAAALTPVLTFAPAHGVGAQPPPTPQPVPQMALPVPPPPAMYHPDVFVPPGTPPGPAIPFHKSGGVVVGAYGFYPYDTGAWLLGGTDGLTRQSGSFTMVFPGAFPEPAAPPLPAPVMGGHFGGKHGLFRR